jgi:hypothetical protein
MLAGVQEVALAGVQAPQRAKAATAAIPAVVVGAGLLRLARLTPVLGATAATGLFA